MTQYKPKMVHGVSCPVQPTYSDSTVITEGWSFSYRSPAGIKWQEIINPDSWMVGKTVSEILQRDPYILEFLPPGSSA